MNEYATKVEECLTAINIEIAKNNLHNKSKPYKNTVINLIINENCSKFGLKTANIKTIYCCAFKIVNNKKVEYDSYI